MGVNILASALISHPGVTADPSAIVSAHVEPERIELQGFDEPVIVPYLPVKGAPLKASERLQWLLDQTFTQLQQGFALTTEQRQQLPLFIGSSCYGIGIGEARYRKAVARDRDDAIPLPLDGFTQIGDHMRRAHHCHGADFALNTACTSTANALLNASAAIESGQTDIALVIGLEVFNTTTLAGFYGMQLLARDHMRPFDLQRDGLVLGEGCAMLLLGKAPSPIGLTLAGGASNFDSFSISASNTDGSSIAAVMQAALTDAGIACTDITAIKAHGTATPLNDDSEAAGMRRLFDALPPFLSLKAYLGHTLGSCGAMETALMATLLQRGTLPASGGFFQSDPKLGVTPLTAPMAVQPGYYLLNFFGFGGNNSSLVLQYGERQYEEKQYGVQA